MKNENVRKSRNNNNNNNNSDYPLTSPLSTEVKSQKQQQHDPVNLTEGQLQKVPSSIDPISLNY